MRVRAQQDGRIESRKESFKPGIVLIQNITLEIECGSNKLSARWPSSELTDTAPAQLKAKRHELCRKDETKKHGLESTVLKDGRTHTRPSQESTP
jgi:hypothetical protein